MFELLVVVGNVGDCCGDYFVGVGFGGGECEVFVM